MVGFQLTELMPVLVADTTGVTPVRFEASVAAGVAPPEIVNGPDA
jgi:hypothetical protein